MFNKDKILSILEDEGLEDIEVIREEDGLVVARFFYGFDSDEIAAAEAFSENGEEENLELEEDVLLDDKLDIEKEEKEDVIEDENLATKELIEEGLEYDREEEEEMYLEPKQRYLSEIAIDFVGELLEDIMEEEKIGVQYIGYQMDEENNESYEFIGLFYDNEIEADIDEILDEMEI